MLIALALFGPLTKAGAQGSNYYDTLHFQVLSGSPGVAGTADGNGALPRYNSPSGVAEDFASYQTYVADTASNTIRRIGSASLVTTFAGTAGVAGSADGTGAAALFSAPWGVAVDASGNIYIADSGNNAVRKITPLGVVTTLAGSAAGPGSADGTGSLAGFHGPHGIAVDAAGNVYVADTGNSTIRKITPAGVVTTLAGAAGMTGSSDGKGTSARFSSPGGIAVDASGTLFVADTGNDTIRSVSPSGAVTTIAGTAGVAGSSDGVGGQALFCAPQGIAVDQFENVVVADTGNDSIRAFSGVQGQAVVITVAGLSGTAGSTAGMGAAALFSSPVGVAAGNSNTFIVADTGNDVIRSSYPVNLPVNPTVTTSAQAVVTGDYFSFVVTSYGDLTQVQWQHNGVDIPGATATTFVGGQASASDAGIYSAVMSSPTRTVTSNFATLTVNTPISFSSSTLATGISGGPNGITVDAQGNVYVSVGDAIERMSSSGALTLVAGNVAADGSANGSGASARFRNPKGLAADIQGNIYVADSGNNQVRVVTPAGMVTTLAGSSSDDTNGGPGAGQFNDPTALTVDASGDVYVVDTGNNALREILPDGSTTTVLSTADVTSLSYIDPPYTIYGSALDRSGLIQALAGNGWDPSGEIPFCLLFHPGAPSSDPWLTQYFWESGGNPVAASMASDVMGNTYVSYDGQFWLRNPDYSWGQKAIGTYNLINPGITVGAGPVGSVYVADSMDGTITVLSAVGGFNFAVPAALPPPAVNPTPSPLSYPAAGSAFVPAPPSASSPVPSTTIVVKAPSTTAPASTQSTPTQDTGASATPSRLANISSRALVGADSNVEIAGFVVSGSAGATEQVLVRGVGPGLSQFNVAGVLEQPVLKLYDSGGNLIASNAGWGSNPNASDIDQAIKASGAFSLAAGSKDSALLLSLAPGSYTAVVSGVNGTTGVALAEVYEMDSGVPRLINISTRAFVGAGSSVEIAGIVIAGTLPAKVLVRSVGPALAQFGVSSPLAAPTLSVVDAQGNVVATNTGWSSAANVAQVATTTTAVGAFALPSGSADCALLLNLPPGAYTAVVSGVGGTSGVALVEAYQAP
ncbi:MAG TPA: hypothetical protein VFE25_02570 [Opitutaceae bacterium]|nr:hypothetical protein [Opitutaceae bacterium]